MPINSSRRPRAFVVPALAIVLASFCSSTAVAQIGPTLEERMSEAQFRSYGLDKLSADELRGLNEWLQNHGLQARTAGAGPGDAPHQDPRLGFREKPGDRVTVNARLAGTFTGWNGSTVFKLDNGQEWQQAEAGSYNGKRVENAEVTIKPKMMGNWLLVVEHCQCRIGVRRIK